MCNNLCVATNILNRRFGRKFLRSMGIDVITIRTTPRIYCGRGSSTIMDTQLVWLDGLQEQERRAGQTLRVSVCRFHHVYKQEQGLNLERNIQRCGMQVVRGRTHHHHHQAAVSRGISRKSLCVYVNFHLCPQVTDNCKCVELSIWTPKRVKDLKSQMASHYARVQHLLSDRGWCSMNRENQLLVTDEPVEEVQDFRKITDINIYTSKSKDATWNETFKVVECKL